MLNFLNVNEARRVRRACSVQSVLPRFVRVSVAQRTCIAGLLLISAPVLRAQSMDDAIFMDRRILCAGLVYTREQWSEYWEGTLRRENGNVGTLTTQQATWMAAYGVTNRLNVLASVPYVWTRANQGVLAGQRGAQDLSVALKYDALSTPLTSAGTLHVIGVLSATTPTTDYTADFYPMSIGSSSKRVAARGILSFQSHRGWYVNAAAGYTRRSNVTLDRPAYFTSGQLFLTNEVFMPDVRDVSMTLGYRGKGVIAPLTLTQQTTLGGADIRRQDAPFVSNRMNFTRLDGRVQYTLPKLRAVQVHVGASQMLAGRNVGRSTSVLAGVLLVGKL
jgi:Putative MetA-pathway of phenol degradation